MVSRLDILVNTCSNSDFKFSPSFRKHCLSYYTESNHSLFHIKKRISTGVGLKVDNDRNKTTLKIPIIHCKLVGHFEWNIS